MMDQTTPDFGPSAALTTLRRRAELTTKLRSFFSDEGYWEVDVPIWSKDCCVDLWIDPIECVIPGAGPGYLQTSPEFAMKRLLAAGADRIWTSTPAFRRDECGTLHNPEFTIVEWYAAAETHRDAIAMTERLVRVVASGTELALPDEPLPVLAYYDLFERILGVRVDAMTASELAAVAIEHAPQAVGPHDRDGWLNILLSECAEPWIAANGPLFVTDYPASQAALAKIRQNDDDVEVAERFELYLHGVEIANGYHELTDATELGARFESANRQRAALSKSKLPVDSQLMRAMEYGMPESAGVALGWDRLVMLCLGRQALEEVVAFPVNRA